MATKIILAVMLVLLVGGPALAQEKKDPDEAEVAMIASEIQASEAEDEVRRLAEEIHQTEIRKKALEKVRSGDDKYEKEARKILRKQAENERKQALTVLRNKAEAFITGCNPEDVAVGSRATDKSRMFPSVTLRVTNTSPFPMTIEDEFGEIVSNLCSGGGITISKSRKYWDGNYIQVQWTAKITTSEGLVLMSPSRQFTLSAWDAQSGRMQQNEPWVVNFPELRYNR